MKTKLLITLIAGFFMLESLGVMLHDTHEDLRKWYTAEGGVTWKKDRVEGYYNPETNIIHCLASDQEVCGHELFHALQYHGEPKYEGEIPGHEH